MSEVAVMAPTPTNSPPPPSTALGRWFRSGRYLSTLAIVLYFAVWFALTEQGFGIVPKIKFPSPLMVVEAAMRMADLIPGDVLATLLRVAIGFTLGVALGLALGLLMSYSKKAQYFFDPLIESMRPVPVVAMIPFFLMWFGIGETGKLLLITLGVFAIIVVSTVEAVRNVPEIYIKAAHSLGASKAQRFRTIIIPAIVPELVGPLRVAAALSFTLVVAAEFMGAQAGLGYRILEARRLFNTDVILLGITIIGILSAIADAAIRYFTAYLTRWSGRAK
ncbi:ABC transporter permease [Brucella anthropi]|uniref:ABC transporter permease n=1 Tax=Brucella anthropi TaxID=529 RepID=UPI000DEC8A3B|nr:ABC transporter permease [Brucella anthropi]RCI77226.1 ABC transporter permease [Brucella anthropi]